MGENTFPLQRGEQYFRFEALVIDDLDTDIPAGVPFMEAMNDISIRPKLREVTANCAVYKYGSFRLVTTFTDVGKYSEPHPSRVAGCR